MTKKINLGKVFLLLLIPTALVSIYFIATKHNEEDECKNVNIDIEFSTEKALLTPENIYHALGFINGKNDLIGKTLGQLKIAEMEEKIKKNKTVKKVEIYMSMGGILNIEISQRTPILRVMPDLRQGYYLCKDGVKIPLSDNFTPDLIPVSGFVNDKIDKTLYAIVGYVNNNSFWKDQIQQFFVHQNQDISFIPTTGMHEVIIGDTTQLDEKFKKLEVFYKKGLNKIGWDKYKSINLKYRGQVVCKNLNGHENNGLVE
jgi:cell division protein FtsQ